MTRFAFAQAAEHAAAVAAAEVKVEAEHTSASKFHRNSGSVVVSRYRGGGCVTMDYFMQFSGFNTFVADVRLSGGCFFFEVSVVNYENFMQFGFCSHGFEGRDNPMGQGVGDDAWSWAVDGHRQLKLHPGHQDAYGSKWAAGDVIGFALDMRTAGAAIFSVSVNGSFAAPNGFAFNDIAAPYLSPAFTGYGQFRVNFGDRPFVHAPPAACFLSVHDANKVELVGPCIKRAKLEAVATSFASASSAPSVAGVGGAVAVHFAASLAAEGAKAGVSALGGGGAATATSSSPPLYLPSPALDASILSPFISRVMSADDEDLELRNPIEVRAPRLGQLSRV